MKCQSVWYCSSKCELAALKSHKPKCQILDGSDSPSRLGIPLPPEPESTEVDPDALGHKMPVALMSELPNLQDPEDILGVKIFSDVHTSNLSSRAQNPRFVEEHFVQTDEIFTMGELCPVTEFYGIPILILFESTRDGFHDDNSPALDLCIGAYGGRGHPET
ncbi:hypothetical protein M413DRAFT_442243 [Hebeloma cylindrosporum]|uniref:MYND-type domain-containing protein n=1 Tax=Hebeloma cylindrosporum TaxID=76867 RepID=A0A0C3CP46_HEBCY|nr:hypothetical protein M413DRAFT_442243 [Hebeloma cylindrosporum h7]